MVYTNTSYRVSFLRESEEREAARIVRIEVSLALNLTGAGDTIGNFKKYESILQVSNQREEYSPLTLLG